MSPRTAPGAARLSLCTCWAPAGSWRAERASWTCAASTACGTGARQRQGRLLLQPPQGPQGGTYQWRPSRASRRSHNTLNDPTALTPLGPSDDIRKDLLSLMPGSPANRKIRGLPKKYLFGVPCQGAFLNFCYHVQDLLQHSMEKAATSLIYRTLKTLERTPEACVVSLRA